MQTDFLLRPATLDYMWDIYELANSSEVRAVSIHSNPIIREEHEKWYLAKLADKTCKLYVVSNASKDFIGTVRFDLSNSREFTITIYLIKEFRGKGLGTQIISEASKDILHEYPDHRIKAEIMEGNQGSLCSFIKAGYKKKSSLLIDSKKFIKLISER